MLFNVAALAFATLAIAAPTRRATITDTDILQVRFPFPSLSLLIMLTYFSILVCANPGAPREQLLLDGTRKVR